MKHTYSLWSIDHKNKRKNRKGGDLIFAERCITWYLTHKFVHMNYVSLAHQSRQECVGRVENGSFKTNVTYKLCGQNVYCRTYNSIVEGSGVSVTFIDENTVVYQSTYLWYITQHFVFDSRAHKARDVLL